MFTSPRLTSRRGRCSRVPTHVCDGRLYATGSGEETGFDPTQAPGVATGASGWEGEPGGPLAVERGPELLGMAAPACPFQDKCREASQTELCRLANNGCDCAFTKATSKGYGCAWLSGTCVPRPTANAAATSCEACPTQVRCGTPVLNTITPDTGTLMGERPGLWSLKVIFDRSIYPMFQADDTGIAMRCNTWEPTGGTVFRLSQPWSMMVTGYYLEPYHRSQPWSTGTAIGSEARQAYCRSGKRFADSGAGE
eukprot:Skav225329  [mRNA]  locus=scaffold748:153646:168171:- [translate_table: standard]